MEKTTTGLESREWLEAAIADFEERTTDPDLDERERERSARWAKIYKEFLLELDEAEWSELWDFYVEKGDRWTAEHLLSLVRGGALVVGSATREVRERLREPLAIVIYNTELQTLHLFGEKLASVCTSILGREPRDAVGELVGAYIKLVVEHVGLGFAHWDWDGRAPWEKQAT